MERFTERLKDFAKEMGANLVGIAPVKRFKNAPEKMSPQGLLPEAKSVVVVAIHHLDAAIELGGEPTPHDFGPYATQSSTMNPKLDCITFHIAKFLEKNGYIGLPIPVTNVWRYRPYKDLRISFAPDLVHRYAAVAAGLGQIGWNGLFLSPEYGPRQRISSVITNAPLKPDPMYNGPVLCDRCMECVKACPTGALKPEILKKENRDINKIEIGGKIFKFPDTNKWRCAWGEHFGLDVSLPIPEKVTEKVILKNLAKYGRHGGAMGMCLKYCMVPHLRYRDPSYTKVWRRKRKVVKITPSEATQKIKTIILKEGIEWLAIGTKDEFKESNIDLHRYLPDAESGIVIGMYYSDEYTKNLINQRLAFVRYDISRCLQAFGFSTTGGLALSDNLAAQAMGLGKIEENGKISTEAYGRKQTFMTILTSCPLSSVKIKPSLKRRKSYRENYQKLTNAVKSYAITKGADLFGVASIKRFEEIFKTLSSNVAHKPSIDFKDDGEHHGQWKPSQRHIDTRIRKPKDYLNKAASVIVIGIHYPDACLDRATEPPSEAIGPYAYAQYETILQLGYVALDVIKFLENLGYQAVPTLDLSNSASKTINSRGPQFDCRSNRYSAVAAGLGEIGWHGVILTPEYRVRQRFISIITDAPLQVSPLYQGPPLCKQCFQCVEACPVNALSKSESVTFKIENKIFKFGKCDLLRCDWAKQYALVGEAGPKYMGSQTDIKPPEQITPQVLSEALKQIDPIQKHHLNIVEMCLKRCKCGKL